MSEVLRGNGQPQFRWGSTTLFGASDECGQLTFTCGSTVMDSVYGNLCLAKVEATRSLINDLKPISADIYNDQLPSSSPDADRERLQRVVDNYHDAWKTRAASHPNLTEDGGRFSIVVNEDTSDRISNFVDRASTEGWVTAGQWYWTIAATTREQQALSRVDTSFRAYEPDEVATFETHLLPKLEQAELMFREHQIDFGFHQTSSIRPSSTRPSDDVDGGLGLLSESWNKAFGGNSHVMYEMVLKDEDPIRSLATYGQYMITAGTVLIGTSLALKATAEGTSSSSLGKTFFGGLLGGVAGGVATLLATLATFLIGMGGTLAYYIPVIPMIFWSLAIMGWMIMIIESLLAAPLWAASHAVPEGDGFAGRYALQGWQLFLNVMLRPILLTIGLMSSMFIMHGITLFALKGYSIFNETMVASTATSAIWGFLFTNLIMLSLTIVLSHKAHEVIFDTADNIMKWIGFGVSPLGSVKSEGEVRQMAKAGSATTERMVGAAVGRTAANRNERDGKRKRDRTGEGGGDDPSSGGGNPAPAGQAGGTKTPGKGDTGKIV